MLKLRRFFKFWVGRQTDQRQFRCTRRGTCSFYA